MGQRGPIRDPNSRRGRAEILKRQKLALVSGGGGIAAEAPSVARPSATGELPTCDKCLPRRVQEIYQNLVIDLAAAKVPIKQVDSHAVTMAARCLMAIEYAEKVAEDGESDPKQILAALTLAQRYGKDLQRWLELICATPGARARIGVKGEPEKKAGALAQMIAARQGRR